MHSLGPDGIPVELREAWKVLLLFFPESASAPSPPEEEGRQHQWLNASIHCSKYGESQSCIKNQKGGVFAGAGVKNECIAHTNGTVSSKSARVRVSEEVGGRWLAKGRHTSPQTLNSLNPLLADISACIRTTCRAHWKRDVSKCPGPVWGGA